MQLTSAHKLKSSVVSRRRDPTSWNKDPRRCPLRILASSTVRSLVATSENGRTLIRSFARSLEASAQSNQASRKSRSADAGAHMRVPEALQYAPARLLHRFKHDPDFASSNNLADTRCPERLEPHGRLSEAFRHTRVHAASETEERRYIATLRSLYPRAARAFLQRDVSLTHSLLSSAFSLIHPPASSSDALASQRRKWDILRITFETTLYASPPSQDPETLPPSLRANLMLTPEPLLTTLHSRSLHLFTPSDTQQKATSAFLPGQILVTLVLASLKLDCPEVGRGMIEDWLAKHGQETDASDPSAYAKVLELYCLHVLPRLQHWEYAEDFLTYERELSPDVRQYLPHGQP
ncbi:hypothetical protein K466DRAFT_606149 [Polyporus arcularius HHB13444]|uniref:Uncharacterized protein n=1 Tax=Polyporus arcularius HHB13444 TaxID=1314778 RepID=A0A5C3NRQ7_9APHY|nr:hypothetical protein K466DRAFT_606149 [Polyporus arcularius HHB13444]